MKLIQLAISSFLIIILLWTITFSAYYTALIVFIYILVFIPTNLYGLSKRIILSSIVSIALLFTIQIPIKEINNNVALLAQKPRNTDTIHVFTFKDKVSMYGLHILISLVGFPLYPEAAKEVFLMLFPADNNIRYFHSDFPMHSKKVQNTLKQFIKSLHDSNENEKTLKKRIAWDSKEYVLGNKEARYALALNPSIMRMRAERNNSKWRIDITLKVPVAFPQNSNTQLISSPDLFIEEGLFWMLQEAGWLYPYEAVWSFSIYDDNRLKNS